MKSSPSWQRLAVSFILVIPFSAGAQAPSNVPRLEHVVVTAARAPQLESEVLGDVSVIDRDELQNAGQSRLAEILSRRHGIESYDQGGPQTAAGISIRG